jgi:hypothetical protein
VNFGTPNFSDVIEGSVAVGEAPKQTVPNCRKNMDRIRWRKLVVVPLTLVAPVHAPMRHNSVAQNDVKTHLMHQRPVVMLLVRGHSSLLRL